MFGFDLDELPEERSQQLPLGEVLPRLPRNKRSPGFACLPENTTRRKDFERRDSRREPRLYLFIFPGCSDTVQNGWLDLEAYMPPYLEVATYEWPGHYERKSEELATSLHELCEDAFEIFREPMRTGRFIVAGHSVGASIMVCVCEKAQKELGVAPLLAFALDRGAPHIPVYSEYGMELLEDDPEEWCKAYNPSVYALKDQPGSSFYRIQINDQKLANDLRPVGWYKFPCPVLVYVAAWQGEIPAPGSEDEKQRLEAYYKVLRPGVGVQAFTEEEFQLWKLWTDECQVYHLDCGHGDLRLAKDWIDMMQSEVRRLLGAATISCAEVLDG